MIHLKHMERRWLFAFFDGLCFVVAFNLALFMRIKVPLVFFSGVIEGSSFGFHSLFSAVIVVSCVYVAIQYFSGLYDIWEQRSSFEWLQSLIIPNCILAGIAFTFLYLMQNFVFPRSLLVAAVIINFSLSLLWRLLYFRFQRQAVSNVVLVSYSKNYADILSLLQKEKLKYFLNVRAVFTCDQPMIQKHDGPAILPISEFQKYLLSEPIDTVILMSANQTASHYMFHLAREIPANVRIFVVPTLYEVFLGVVRNVRIADIPLIQIPPFTPPMRYWLPKRLFDIVTSCIGIVVCAFPMIVIAFLIRVTSPGPAIFRQVRVGKDGRSFMMYKFRTMYSGADTLYGVQQACKNDHRITTLGRFLRKTRLDEFPQFFNILKGDMSLVGPRPLVVSEVEKFERSVPAFSERGRIRPGVTGLAQINGHYETTPDIKLKYDLAYIRRQSLLLDFEIILRTAKTVITRAGQ